MNGDGERIGGDQTDRDGNAEKKLCIATQINFYIVCMKKLLFYCISAKNDCKLIQIFLVCYYFHLTHIRVPNILLHGRDVVAVLVLPCAMAAYMIRFLLLNLLG